MAQINIGNTNSGSVKVPPSFKDVGVLRVKKASYGKSKSSGKDQITLVTEIIKPDEVELDGNKYILSGQEITFYLGLSDEKAPNAKASPLSNTKDFHQKVGLGMEIDTDNLPYEGLCFEYYLQSTENALQRPKAGGGYEFILDEQGNKRSLGWEWINFLGNTIGPSSVNTNAAY